MKTVKRFFFICISFSLLIFANCTHKNKSTESTVPIAQSSTLPQRIVSLSPAGTEILYALGAEEKIVARTDFCDFPASITKKPSVGGFSGETLSIETILSFSPDFVYGTQGIHDMLSLQLEQANVKVRLSQAQSTEDVLLELIEVSKIVTGNEEEGKLCAKSIQDIFKRVQNLVSNTSVPLVYYEVWNEPFMSIGSKSYINDIVEAAGGKNIFFDVAEEYPMVSEEAIVARNPQIIIIPDMNGETHSSVSARHGWNNIEAVKEGNIYFAESNVFSRPGPRITEALGAMAKMIHPELDFSTIDFVVVSDNVGTEY